MSVAVSATKLEVPTAEDLMAAADVAFANMERENEAKASFLDNFASVRFNVRQARA
ncbi:MAG: hypothetical protein Q3976_09525 [Corynebacterium sp.]|nr:hypothetical protein [Corynebacterium sp.]